MKKRNQSILKWLMVFAVMLMGTSVFAATVTETFKDNFQTGDYTGNTGSKNFDGDWYDDQNQNPNSGDLQVNGGSSLFGDYALMLRDLDNGNRNIDRDLDLSNAASLGYGAVLALDYDASDANNHEVSITVME